MTFLEYKAEERRLRRMSLAGGILSATLFFAFLSAESLRIDPTIELGGGAFSGKDLLFASSLTVGLATLGGLVAAAILGNVQAAEERARARSFTR